MCRGKGAGPERATSQDRVGQKRGRATKPKLAVETGQRRSWPGCLARAEILAVLDFVPIAGGDDRVRRGLAQAVYGISISRADGDTPYGCVGLAITLGRGWPGFQDEKGRLIRRGVANMAGPIGTGRFR